MNNAINIEQLRELINDGEAKDPLIFLESIMNGLDPRDTSEIYELILEIDDFTDGDISKEDWESLIDIVREKYKYVKVSLADSLTASKTLAEYLYPKRKQVDIGGTGTGAGANVEKLTQEEIELFKEVWNEEF